MLKAGGKRQGQIRRRRIGVRTSLKLVKRLLLFQKALPVGSMYAIAPESVSLAPKEESDVSFQVRDLV